MAKHWIKQAVAFFKASRDPVPHEINELDWKATLSANKERLIEHLIAFANHANGGYLVYGVADQGAKLLGVDEEQVQVVATQLTNLGRDAIEPALVLDHAVVEEDGVPLLFVYVREQASKPVHRRGKSIEEAWIRSGGSTRKASRSEIGSLMLHSHAPRWEELRASPLLTEDEVLFHLDLATIAKLLERPLPQENQELMRWLLDERMIESDATGYYITHLGGIAAARDLSLFDSLSRKPIRVIRYRGLNKVETIDEMVGKKGYAVGFEGLITYLKRVLPHSEVIEQSLRQRVSMYPEIALRELIANALIHQDFTITGAGPTIEVFDDRITFTNPVLFTALDNGFQVTIFAPRKFADMSQQDRIEACYQHSVLQYLSSQTLTNKSLRARFKISDRQSNQITNLISDAVAAGRIKRKDSASGNKFADYIPYWA